MNRIKEWVGKFKVKYIVIGTLVISILAGSIYMLVDTTEGSEESLMSILFNIKKKTEDVFNSTRELFIPKELMDDKKVDSSIRLSQEGKQGISSRLEGKDYGPNMKEHVDKMEENKDYRSSIDWTHGTISDSDMEELFRILTKIIMDKEGKKVELFEDIREEFEVSQNDYTLILPVIIKDIEDKTEVAKKLKVTYEYDYLIIVE